MPIQDTPPQSVRLSIGRPLAAVQVSGRPLTTNPSDAGGNSNRCDFYWQNTAEARAALGLPEGEDGTVFLVGIHPWIGATLDVLADLMVAIWISDGVTLRFVGSHAWDRYARSNGPHSPYLPFQPNYFEVPNNWHIAMWSVGTTVSGEHGMHHGVCSLYFAKERP